MQTYGLTMIKNISFYAVLMVLLTFSSTMGQEAPADTVQYNYGIKIGLNFAKFTGEGSEDFNTATGLHFGGLVRRYFNDNIYAQTEFILSEKGGITPSQIDSVSLDVTLSLSYFEIPLLIGYDFMNASNNSLHPVIYGGPFLAIKSKSTIRGDFEDQHTELDYEDVKTFDYGFVLGGSMEFAIKDYRVVLDVRLVQSVLAFDESSDNLDLRNSSIVGTVGFMF